MASSSTSEAEVPRKLWEHPDPASTQMWHFMQDANKKHGLQLRTFDDLHNYSLTRRSDFWADVFDAAGFVHGGRYTSVVDESLPIDAIPKWFPGVTLNFAENMLYTRASPNGPAD